jgi:hypothetical protein
VNNVFDRNPPRTTLTPGVLGYDPANADPRGRQLALQIRTQW